MNQFLKNMTKKDTFTENMAVSNSSTGNAFVDDFSKAANYRGRDFAQIIATSSNLWTIDPLLFLKLTFYLRLITRKVKGLFNTQQVQRGQGAKNESLQRLLWVAFYHPIEFYKNLWLVPLAGSWKDLWTLMVMDVELQAPSAPLISHRSVFELMIRGLNDPSMRSLVLKYMPQIRAKSKLKTSRALILNSLAKEFAGFMDIDAQAYRKLKTTGEAHIWQQQISKQYFDQINFSNIPGKALAALVDGKFLTNHNLLEKYSHWLDKQPVIKFNGYAFELMKRISSSPIKNKTIDKQFDMLIQTAKTGTGGIKGNIWCALDTSGSMDYKVLPDVSAFDICISLGVYFSAMNEGAFKDHIIMFDERSSKLHLHGTFTEKIAQIKAQKTAWGSTNFQSVIDEIVRIRTLNPFIPVEDYPQTLLVVSDMQFNPVTGINTNYETAMHKLRAVGLPEITIIWWQVTDRTSDYPSTTDDKGTVMLSGFDGAVISLILGGEPQQRENITLEAAMQIALDQELLNLVQI